MPNIRDEIREKRKSKNTIRRHNWGISFKVKVNSYLKKDEQILNSKKERDGERFYIYSPNILCVANGDKK